jgi:hypothetical protein
MSEAQAVVLLLALFGIKHFVVDYPLQKPYQFMNKGTYGHPGGLLHAGLHAIGTVAVLWLFADIEWIAIMAALDFTVHYHVDWAKMRINERYGWKSDKHEQFWILLGFDQLLHWLTYVAIIGLTIGAF